MVTSVISPLEGDTDSPSVDLQDTARTRLDDSISHTGQSRGSDSSEEKVRGHVADRQTKRTSSPRSRRATKRARVTLDATSAQGSPIALSTQPRSESPAQNENPAEPADNRSHYVRSFETLTSKHGEGSDFDLTPAQIIDVIKSGDSFLRERPGEFVMSYLESCRDEA